MKALKITLITVCILGMQLHPVLAQNFSVKSFSVSVNGSSSLHDWESTVNKLEAKGFFVVSNSQLAEIRDVVVKIPVKAIVSTKGKMMDNKTWEAFDADKNPTITFIMKERTIDAGKGTMTAKGTLTMAGTTRPIDLTVQYKLLPGGELLIKGTKSLLMSEFNMDPPTAMMGTIKVGDEVKIVFELQLINNNTL